MVERSWLSAGLVCWARGGAGVGFGKDSVMALHPSCDKV